MHSVACLGMVKLIVYNCIVLLSVSQCVLEKSRIFLAVAFAT
jgi:hypothetical protein